jgi:hypothetical protein
VVLVFWLGFDVFDKLERKVEKKEFLNFNILV